MPRYFMNLRYRDRLFADEEGDELLDDTAVRAHAIETARDLIANARVSAIRNWLDCTFEITDDGGRLVLTMPFSQAI